jgi:hypothetical protein
VNRGACPVRKMRSSWTLRAWRSPLRRRVDRLEAAVLIGLAVVFVISAPVLAISAAQLAGVAGLRELRAESAWRQVPATLLENASSGVPAEQAIPGGAASNDLVWARWDSPSGRLCKGVIEVPPGMRALERVTIWVTKTGKPAAPPLSPADLEERSVLAVLGSVLGLAIALSGAAVGVRLAANRHRMAGWDRAWAATSPRWSQSW